MADGQHTLYIYAKNAINLEDEISVDFTIDNTDTTPPQITVYSNGREASVTGDNTLETAPWLVGLSTCVFSLSDSGSGLSWFALYDPDSGELLSWDFFDGTAHSEAQFYLPQDTTGYLLNVADESGNESNMYFHIDRHEPKVEFSTVNVNLSGSSFNIDVYGTTSDAVAGIGAGPTMLTNPPVHEDLGVHNTGATYPAGPVSSSFSYTGLGSQTSFVGYMFLAADKADNLGTNELWLSPLAQDINIPGMGDYVDEDNIAHEGLYHLPGVPSGRRINHLSITLTYPHPPSPNCSFAKDTAGMTATLIGFGYTPDSQESVAGTYWDNIPLKFNYQATADSFTATNEVNTSTSLAWVLPQYTAIQLTRTGNSNTIQQTCTIDTVDGTTVVVTAIPPGSLKYDVDAVLSGTWLSIVAPEVVYREWVTPDFNTAVKAGIIEVEIDKITQGGRVTISKTPYDPQIPDYRLAGDKYVYDVNIGAVYEGNVRVTFDVNMSGLTARQRQDIAIYHNGGSGWNNVTTGVGDGYITYIGPTASPFVVLVPVDDTMPPQTSLSLIGAAVEANNKTYISSITAVELNAFDTALDPADVSGVVTTYYLIDIEPTAECLAAPYNAAAAPGTCTNPVYTGPFTLQEGARVVSYLSVDKAGNNELLKTAAFYVDGTPPVSSLLAGSTTVVDAGIAYITEGGTITLSAVDPELNGATSNVMAVYYLVEISLDSCGEMGPVVSTAPAGSCQNYLYTGPFTLAVGTHTVYYTAVDNVGNMAPVKSALITVSPVNSNLDVVPPVTTLAFGAPRFGFEPVYVSSQTGIYLNASDTTSTPGENISGVATSYYSIDSDTFSVYAGTFSITAGGEYVVRYYSVDAAGNVETVNISSVAVDNTAPVSELRVYGSSTTDAQGNLVVSTNSYISFISSDSVSGVGSGLQHLMFSLDGGPYSAFQSTFTLSEGLHRIVYYGVDNVSNAESVHTFQAFFGRAPETAIWTGLAGGGNW